MPKPNRNETKQEYITRCIPYMIENEGKERDQAVAMCYSFWEQYQKEDKDIIAKIEDFLAEDGNADKDKRMENLKNQATALQKRKQQEKDRKKKADIGVKLAGLRKKIIDTEEK
jgi:hypothetical protein